MDQKNKGRARVRIAVFVVLAIHGIGLLALLMQGCKKEPEVAAPPAEQTDTNAPAFAEPTNALPAGATNAVAAATNIPSETPPPPLPLVTTATEYKVAQGDTFSSIAKKFNVSSKAIGDANPGVDPKRLKIGQTLHIPPPTPAAATNGGSTAGATATGAGQVYSVKSGDTLSSIAAHFGVSVRALSSANHLTTTRITVGQKLTIPAKAPAPTAPAATNTGAGAAPAGTGSTGQ